MTEEEKVAKDTSAKIDRDLIEHAKLESHVVKVLLLGKGTGCHFIVAVHPTQKLYKATSNLTKMYLCRRCRKWQEHTDEANQNPPQQWLQ